MENLIYKANHTNNTAIILADAIFAFFLALFTLASRHTKNVILSAELWHELKNVSQYESDHAFLKQNKLRSLNDLDRDIAATGQQIETLAAQRGKVRNQIRHETNPQILSQNKAERAAITAQIAPLRKRIKRLNNIRKDAPRLLNLLKTELRREYELRHPVKEQQRQKPHSYEQER